MYKHHNHHEYESLSESGSRRGYATPAVGDTASPVVDPVCGMKVDPATSKHRADRDGQSSHFCSAGCRTKFVADPEKYLAAKPADIPISVQKDVIYTCPMHPQIRRDGSG